MGESPNSIFPHDLIHRIGSADCPVILDVRRRDAYAEAPDVIPTAKWRDPRAVADWAAALPSETEVVVYCVHGHQVGQAAAAALRQAGIPAAYLRGGIEGYRAAGGPLLAKAGLPGRCEDRPSRWITRERPKIDRIACPWFIRRFVDHDAAIYYVSAEWVLDAAKELDAVPFDVPNVSFSHDGPNCSFDAFLGRFAVNDTALDRLAAIVRGADTGKLDLTPQSAGLLALSLGLSAIHADDHAMLERGMLLYDALYGWCRHATAERHGWPPVLVDAAQTAGGGQ